MKVYSVPAEALNEKDFAFWKKVQCRYSDDAHALTYCIRALTFRAS
jgi:hypothetical protein